MWGAVLAMVSRDGVSIFSSILSGVGQFSSTLLLLLFLVLVYFFPLYNIFFFVFNSNLLALG